jgi:hypothetical protein
MQAAGDPTSGCWRGKRIEHYPIRYLVELAELRDFLLEPLL